MALLPSAVFALAFVLLGWIASHSIAYALVGLVPSGPPHGHYDPVSSHYPGEEHIHGYMSLLKLAGGVGFVLAFGLALRSFFRYGSFGEWLHEGGLSGTRKQVVLATVLPASVFVLIEHLERLAAGMGTTPSARLLVLGVFVQLAVGLLCLALVRLTFRVAEQVIRSIARRLFVWPDLRAGVALEGVVLAWLPCPMAGSKAGRAPPALLLS